MFTLKYNWEKAEIVLPFLFILLFLLLLIILSVASDGGPLDRMVPSLGCDCSWLVAERILSINYNVSNR